MVLAGDGLAEVDLVQVLLLVGEVGEVGNPVPAGEGVALAGGLCGLAHHAVRVGNALHGIVAVSELATVSSVQDIDFVLVLHPLGIHRYMRLGNWLSKIDLVLLFLLFGEDAQVGNPVPASEGITITCGSHGLAHHAVGVGETLLNFLTISELAAIGNIQNVGLVLYFILSPLSEHRNGLTSNRLVETDLVGSLLLVGIAGVIRMPVPTSKGVAIAGGRRRLTEFAISVGNALHGFIAVYELAAVSSIQNVDLVLFRFLLVGLVIHIKRGDALQGGGHVHFFFAGCRTRNNLCGGIPFEALNAICNAAVCSNVNRSGYAGTITFAALEEAYNLNTLSLNLCVLFPCSKPAACLGGRRIELVILLIILRNAIHVGLRVPTLESIARTSRRRSIDASVLVRLDGYSSAAIGELSTICRKRKLGLGRLLGSSSLAILIGVIGQCYCRHATKSKRQAQACRNCFLRTQILHLFSFSHCISPRLYASD